MARFKKIGQVPGGHSFWRHELGALAVADGSMRDPKDPSTTDDGLLLVDTDALLTAGMLTLETDKNERLSFHYPVNCTRGGVPRGKGVCGGGPAEALFLARILWGDDAWRHVRIATSEGYVFVMDDGPWPKFDNEKEG